MSSLSKGSFASLRYSSESENESNNKEIDQYEDCSKCNSLHGIVEWATGVELMELLSVVQSIVVVILLN